MTKTLTGYDVLVYVKS